MKNRKNHIIIRSAIVLAIIISLGATVFALNSENGTDNGDAAESAVFMQKETELTGSVGEIKTETNLESYGYKVAELAASEIAAAEGKMISRDKALAIAVQEAESIAKSEASSVNAVCVKFTDPETDTVPNTKISLNEIPVWLVTFNDVTLERGGPAGDYDRSIKADINVVIDLETGEVFEIISHAA